ncbi:MAG: PQQ-like beta-propeller repeat protein [Planctomycetes bacterium]|nr:PQQ-like beta-propeller repeat protein [Planctomycetota bacterium]
MSRRAVLLLSVVACCAAARPVGPCAAAEDVAPRVASASAPAAERPVGWRGDGSGCYPSADPPAKWSADQNVLWKAEVGRGCSSPILVGGRVLVTSEPDLLVCLDASSGKELWRKVHKLSDLPPALDAQAPGQSGQYGQATPTPVSDGKCVWVFFHTGIVACYDLDGTRRWLRWYKMRLATGYGRTASPVLVGGRLLVHFGPLACLDAATGELLWTCDAAKATYGTPVRARLGDVDVAVTPKGDIVRLADGKVLAADLGNCMYPSPVVQGRTVYFIGSAMTAVELPDKAADEVAARELWYAELEGDFYASPVVHDGRVYTVDRAANFYVIDAATGKTVLKKTLPLSPAGGPGAPNVYPSICLAGKRLLVSNDAGEAVFIEPGDKGALVGEGTLPAGCGATPTFTGGRVFVRGGEVLYCLGPAPLRP